ncbi:hypothetical protein [Aurantimonas manganoxydans]|uniref:hypothetical protein n=1 Tax=Aurantimonas manganoxydans TaxID=651183 RepID=UPI0011D23B62|nr:hypothetical protein [Aurantimonas manganoxydans]
MMFSIQKQRGLRKAPGTHPELAMQPGVRPRLGDRVTKIMARFLPFKSARKPAVQIFLRSALPRARRRRAAPTGCPTL